jgi:hypothetical protein
MLGVSHVNIDFSLSLPSSALLPDVFQFILFREREKKKYFLEISILIFVGQQESGDEKKKIFKLILRSTRELILC